MAKIAALCNGLWVLLLSGLAYAQTAPPSAGVTPPVAAPPQPPLPPWVPPDVRFTYAVIAAVFVVTLIVFATIARVLGDANSKWSLGDALSEETDLTVDDADGKPYNVNGTVVKNTELRASSSRLIAFIGTIAILTLFLGFGSFMLWDYANTGVVRETSQISSYLVAGLTLFAPYVVNKFSSVFAPK